MHRKSSQGYGVYPGQTIRLGATCKPNASARFASHFPRPDDLSVMPGISWVTAQCKLKWQEVHDSYVSEDSHRLHRASHHPRNPAAPWLRGFVEYISRPIPARCHLQWPEWSAAAKWRHERPQQLWLR